jgi:hypothetical protein
MLGVAAVFLLSGGPALAKDEPKSPEQKLVCKRVYGADLGSHFQSSKRVCHTAAEWKEIEDETNRTLSTIRDNGGASGTTSPGGFGGSPQ